MIEVPIASVKNEIVLQHEGREPHIICRDRSPLLTELAKQRAIVMRGLIVRKQRPYALFRQETSQRGFVLLLLAIIRKPGSQLGEYDKRENDDLCFGQNVFRFNDAVAKINISIRVERNPHFQRSSST